MSKEFRYAPGSSARLQTIPPTERLESGKSCARRETSWTMESLNVIHCWRGDPTPFRPKSGPPRQTKSMLHSHQGDGQAPVNADAWNLAPMPLVPLVPLVPLACLGDSRCLRWLTRKISLSTSSASTAPLDLPAPIAPIPSNLKKVMPFSTKFKEALKNQSK